ncbi:hypothetical protein Prudu_022080 [Prunus dulcis]|uniref:Alcohol dehydrogenase-like N-terminal domain-containing protein n=1 Tax=Prunus dulcis TaxID=3755 RepID=A0A4Y1RYW3_PRUDU|nr:hypothetical protein Prudu_022080 [Prunus dulcis]
MITKEMELKPGLSALVTGGASGIGKALSLALGAKGIFVTKENANFHTSLGFPSALFVKCDVTDTGNIAAAFEKHLATFGGLDICINSAGIINPIPFHKDQTDGTRSWRLTVNLNLIAVIDCTRLAIKTMQAVKKPGVIINMGSAAGLYPLDGDPIYSGSKGGVVQFTRSLVPYKHKGIRINVLCPEYNGRLCPYGNGSESWFMPMDYQSKSMEYWPTPAEEAKYLISQTKRAVTNAPFQAPLNLQLPQSFEKLVVHTLSHNFRNATGVVRTPLRLPIKPDHVLVKVIYAGVNASDVNYSSGRYFSGSNKDLESQLPFDWAVGIIAAVGESVTNLKVGTPAAIMTFGSGSGQLESGKVVLVTAAAGGTGQFAVQVLKKEFPKGVDIIYESVGGDIIKESMGGSHQTTQDFAKKLLAKSQTVVVVCI